MSTNENKVLLKNSIIYTIGGVFTKAIAYLLVPLYTSYMSTSEYGIADLFQLTVNIFLLICSVKIASSLVRFTIEDKGNASKYLIASFVIIVMSSVIATLVYWAIAENFLNISISPIYFWLLYVLYGARELLSEDAKALEHNKIYVIDSLIYGCFQIVSGWLLLTLMSDKVMGFVYSQICALVISIVFLVAVLGKHFFSNICKIDVILIKQMLEYSKYLAPAAAGFWIIQFSDRYMVNYILGSAAAGIYAVAYKVPSICGVIVNFFLQAWYFSSIHEKDNAKYYSSVFSVYQAFIAIVTNFIVIFAKLIANIMFQKDFFDAWIYIPMLVLAVSFSYYAFFLENIFVVYKDTKTIFYSIVGGAISNIVLNFILIYLFGIWGAIIATMVSYLIVFIVRYMKLRKKQAIWVNKRISIINTILVVISVIYSNRGMNTLFIQIVTMILMLINNYNVLKNVLSGLVSMIIKKK